MLKNWMKREYIAVKQQASDWMDAIHTASEPLVRHGAVEERYAASMIDAVKRLGPYIAIAPGIAIAHAKPEDGVRQCAIGITTFRLPVVFGSKANDPISLIVTLAAIDHDAHLDAMSDLMDILGDSEKCTAIQNAADVDTVCAVVGLSGGNANG